jgi:predicted dehydrogenase
MKMNRRRFLASSTAAFGFQVVASHVLRAAPGATTPNGKIRIAAIGCGGQGGSDLNGMQAEDIVALCDVDDRRAAKTFEKFPNAKRFRDFRVMFDQMADQIDAVLVATPDHTHRVAAMAAINRGKHVYCEKPLAHSIADVRALREAALRHKVITQVGNQGHSSESIRVFCELVWAGAVGNVTEVHAGCGAFKNIYCQIGQHPDLAAGKLPVPKELDWDLWLGPAKERPYHPAYLPFNWRGFADFGCGCLGDWVCHVLDPIFWAADLDLPTAITAETVGWDPQKDRGYFPKGSRITYEFAAKGKRPGLKIIWHDGAFSIPRPPELAADRKMTDTGAVIRGDAGVMMHGSHGAGGVRILPEERHREFVAKGVEKKIERVKGGHQADWLNAIRTGGQAGSSFEYGGALTEVGLLGVIALQFPGQRLEWDAKAMKFTNLDAANALVAPAVRKGWEA